MQALITNSASVARATHDGVGIQRAFADMDVCDLAGRWIGQVVHQHSAVAALM